MNAQRARTGQGLTAVGAAALVAALVIVSLTTTVLSGSAARDATPDLVGIDAAHTALVDALAAEVPSLLAPGTITEPTARAVAERMVRDSNFVDGSRDAVEDAHRTWRAGGGLRVTVPSEVLSPVAVAALRDVDLDLARALPARPTLAEVSIDLEVTDAGVPRDLRSTGVVVGVVGLLMLVAGGILDPRTDRALRRTAGALGAGAAILAALVAVATLVDLSARDVAVPAAVAMVAVSGTTLLLVALAAVLVAAFTVATASQVTPLVDQRERRRVRRMAGPPPASSGTQGPRRRGRAVRQQAIDAFFEGEQEDAPTAPEPPEVVDLGHRETPLVAYRGDGFDEAIAAVDADPGGGTTARSTSDDDDDDGEGGTSADAAAADRREALERIDGSRGRLRTHLPR
ncbi:hypothetical protein [Actinomarinicola tropica]|uniref:Uncharacterized protein n=1 Tax=Actinomarinicola tropica TaxID=2789776 RepID=A0A5Q2RR02_9ACTN|nr:hypothetical protein [Actinomarinicola tropica]QGG95615.1 hypothetical protein GH723_11190 [Actinomarinicola tropica]